MNLLPQGRGKKIMFLMVLVVLVGGIIYLNFFYASSPRDTDSQGLDEFARLQVELQNKKLLPYGEKLATEILEEEKFASLRAVSPLFVGPEELGKINPFIAQ